MKRHRAASYWKIVPILLISLMTANCPGPGGTDGDKDNQNGQRDDPGGRIPGCFSDDGIDLFAAEGDEVLGLAWNNIGESDASGGYRVRFGVDSEDFSDSVVVDCTDLECEFTLTGLENGVTLFLQVESLDSNGEVTATSCSISAAPKVLAFLDDLRVNESRAGEQNLPDIVAQEEGMPLFLAWEDEGEIKLARSDDLGDTWSDPVTLGSGTDQAGPSLAFRDQVVVVEEMAGEGEGESAEGGEGEGQVEVVLPPLLFVAFTQGTEVMLARATFPEELIGSAEFGSLISLGTGTEPDVTISGDRLHVAWEDQDMIFSTSSDPDELFFESPIRVDTGSEEDAHVPSIAADSNTGNVFIAYHARRGAGDFNVYVNTSTDGGLTFGSGEVRIDDDDKGQNQINISLAVDRRTGQVLATWEDRRGGANVFFSSSDDNGQTWLVNIETGAGLSGDQFTPKAVVDPGRNIYVVFLDTSDGKRPMFSRFNPEGTFDPPLPVSTAAGMAGAEARNPAVAIDNFGTIYVTWAENRDSPNVDIYFARAE